MNEIRKIILRGLVITTAVIFLIKLFSIQILENKYSDLADSNSLLRIVEYPYRGLIFDRNGKLLVYNQPEFDLMVQLNEIDQFDSALFCSTLNIERGELSALFVELKARKEFEPYRPTLFIDKLSNNEVAKFQDLLDNFHGFYLQPRTSRAYNYPSAANALGYVSEISREQLSKDKDKIYRQGDYIGQSGLEAYYEPLLRGKRGIRNKWKDAKGIERGAFKDGKYDTLSEPGINLISTLDIDLQQYAEKLLTGKSGSVVAIEPSSGEILAFVSGPSYDPGLLSGKLYGENFKVISADTNKPLFNRPLMAQYRPGSIFKVAQSMIALEAGVIMPETRIRCDRSVINCHGTHSNEDLRGAITNSCNPYFHSVFKRLLSQAHTSDPFKDSRVGLEQWHKNVVTFGFGSALGIDLPNEKNGLMPSVAYYDKAYRNRPWKFSNIYSLAIGEGENLVTPIQMANFAAILANRGFYYAPHLVRSIGNSGKPLPEFQVKHVTSVDTANFRVAVDAMENVVNAGTATRARIPGIAVCGKTGSVENDPFPEHSVFIAFAPKENPQIAIAVYVEFSGMGGRAASSIAGLVMEKYLKGTVTRTYIEDYVFKGDFED
jgi:penicillin-binding protein 2